MKHDPLTLAMTHPLKSRVARLSAEPSGFKGRCAALALLFFGTALAAPVTAAETSADNAIYADVFVELSPDFLARMQTKREAVVAGTMTTADFAAFMDSNPARFTVSADRRGAVEAITSGAGEPLAAIAPATVAPLARRCAAQSVLPAFFTAELPGGTATVECAAQAPSAQPIGRAYTDRRIAALRLSGLDKRAVAARARGMMAWHLRERFRQGTPDPTPEQRYQHCLDTLDTLNRDYGYLDQPYDPAAASESCARYKPG